MVKKRRGRPRKYRTREQLLKARRRWASEWRKANPERWRAIQHRADAKRRKKSVLSFPPLDLGDMKPKAKRSVALS